MLDGLLDHNKIIFIVIKNEPHGDLATVGEDAALGARLAAIRGVLLTFSPEGGFDLGLVHREPFSVNTLQGIISH